MNMEFNRILREHAERYPLMQPQDYVKLAYQSEFGPEHMVKGSDRVIPTLLEEWGTIQNTVSPPPEPLGNGLSRFHLGKNYRPDEAAPLLAELFVHTSQKNSGTQAGLWERLETLKALRVGGMDAWLEAYGNRGCPPVHHSAMFRKAYHPHYRVVRSDYVNYFPVFLSIRSLIQSGKPVMVAIDGRCGSGKTTLAALIEELFPCAVFHMDHFYLPMEQRLQSWMETPAGNMDLGRFLREVLLPARQGSAVRYRPFDCRTGQYAEETLIPAKRLTVLEGSYSQHPILASQYDLKVFLTCSQNEQNRRLKGREGTHFEAFQTHWIPMEERYLRAYNIPLDGTITLDTSDSSTFEQPSGRRQTNPRTP